MLLQKTLLNIEGLGRDLDPELDLWKTAKPYLERWMSEQIGWKALARSVRDESSQWAVILPQLPRLLHKALATERPHLDEREVRDMADRMRRQTRWLWIAWGLLVALVSWELHRHFFR